MKVKQTLFIFLLTVAHVCYGQFFYTDYQDSKFWLETNKGQFSDSSEIKSKWQDYLNQKNYNNKNPHHFGSFLHYKSGFQLNSIYQKSDLVGNGLMTNYRFHLSNFEIVNSMYFTYDSLEANRGFVRTIKNVTMYTNQSYLKMSNEFKGLKYTAKIGRDFFTIGHGLNSFLFISDYSRPFDQFFLKGEYGRISGTFAVIALDTLNEHNRYSYIHSLNYEKDKLSITIGETVLATGISRSIDLNYINPFHFWSWENLGNTNKGLNAFLYAGMTWFPNPSIRMFGEVLIDDINFHQKDAFYLNRFGFLLGFQKTGFPSQSSNLWIEYSNVLNQVYQSYHPTHIYTHRGFPIGHYLGNDFINVRAHYSQLSNSARIKSFIDISYLLDGSNGLETPFDNPWENEKGEFLEDYDPPSHPTPPVTTWIESEVGAEVNLGYNSYITITAQYQQKSIKNESFSDFGLGIRFWSYLQYPIKSTPPNN